MGRVSATFAAGTPHPALRGVVLRYEGYEERAGGPVTFRELPCTFVPIIIDLDAGMDGRSPPARRAAAARLLRCGRHRRARVVGHGGSARCLQVDLTPLGARRLVGMPMSELANQTVPIEAVLGRFGRDLVQRVGDAPDWPTRFALIDEAMRARLAEAAPVDPVWRGRWAGSRPAAERR